MENYRFVMVGQSPRNVTSILEMAGEFNKYVLLTGKLTHSHRSGRSVQRRDNLEALQTSV